MMSGECSEQLALDSLVGQLSEFYPPDEARLWLFAPHKLLGGDRPAAEGGATVDLV
jgi:hypothetical protein